MKKTIIYRILTVVLFLSCAYSVVAQEVYNKQIQVNQVEMKQVGSQLHVNMLVDMTNLDIDTQRGLTLTPVLKGEGQEVEFSSVLINGNTRQKVYDRSMGLDKNQIDTHYAVLKVDRDTKQAFNYSQTIAYEPWMKDAKLYLKEDLCGCGGYTQQINEEPLLGTVIPEKKPVYEIKPVLAYIQPKVEAVKARNEQREVFLNFPVGKTVILHDYMDNAAELMEIENGLKEIKADNNITVTRIDIIGYASPEGSLKLNQQLSEGRAEALRKRFTSNTYFPADVYHVQYGGENWQGLVDMIKASTMDNKAEIISLIENTSDDAVRKQKLKAFGNGVPYRHMLAEFYPKLRKVICNVNYTVKSFSVEEGKEILKTRPQYLSLNEMYQIANTYPKGGDAFVDVFETAVRMYPNDEAANLNAAAAALSRKDFTKAEKYLDKSDKNSSEYENNMGVYYLLKGDFVNAEKVLTKAMQKGSTTAKTNLDELKKKFEIEK